jgi:hypothetical protein
MVIGQFLHAKAAFESCEPSVRNIGKFLEVEKERFVLIRMQRRKASGGNIGGICRGTMGSPCQSALAASLFSPAGLLALVAILTIPQRPTSLQFAGALRSALP